jgi:hypothetical protein
MKSCVSVFAVLCLVVVMCSDTQAQCPGGVCPVRGVLARVDLGQPGTPILDKLQEADRPLVAVVAAPFKAVAERKPVRRIRLFRRWR